MNEIKKRYQKHKSFMQFDFFFFDWNFFKRIAINVLRFFVKMMTITNFDNHKFDFIQQIRLKKQIIWSN